MAKPNKNAPLGQGGRFAAFEQKLENQGYSKKSADNIAAAKGRAKYGKKKMAAMSLKGRMTS